LGRVARKQSRESKSAARAMAICLVRGFTVRLEGEAWGEGGQIELFGEVRSEIW
jgi:hypothetical protein